MITLDNEEMIPCGMLADIVSRSGQWLILKHKDGHLSLHNDDNWHIQLEVKDLTRLAQCVHIAMQKHNLITPRVRGEVL